MRKFVCITDASRVFLGNCFIVFNTVFSGTFCVEDFFPSEHAFRHVSRENFHKKIHLAQC